MAWSPPVGPKISEAATYGVKTIGESIPLPSGFGTKACVQPRIPQPFMSGVRPHVDGIHSVVDWNGNGAGAEFPKPMGWMPSGLRSQ